MLPRENRLVGRFNFENVKRKGKLFNSGPLGLSVYTRSEKLPTRIGIIVSLKISKKAVERNRIKRMVRESLRKQISKIKKGFDIVFLTKTSIIDKDRATVDSCIKNLLERAQLLIK